MRTSRRSWDTPPLGRPSSGSCTTTFSWPRWDTGSPAPLGWRSFEFWFDPLCCGRGETVPLSMAAWFLLSSGVVDSPVVGSSLLLCCCFCSSSLTACFQIFRIFNCGCARRCWASFLCLKRPHLSPKGTPVSRPGHIPRRYFQEKEDSAASQKSWKSKRPNCWCYSWLTFLVLIRHMSLYLFVPPGEEQKPWQLSLLGG